MKNLNEMNVTEKKALAYDIMAQMENLNRQLQVVNQEISNELNKEVKEFPDAKVQKKEKING